MPTIREVSWPASIFNGVVAGCAFAVGQFAVSVAVLSGFGFPPYLIRPGLYEVTGYVMAIEGLITGAAFAACLRFVLSNWVVVSAGSLLRLGGMGLAVYTVACAVAIGFRLPVGWLALTDAVIFFAALAVCAGNYERASARQPE